MLLINAFHLYLDCYSNFPLLVSDVFSVLYVVESVGDTKCPQHHSVSGCSGDWSTRDHSSRSWTNVARPCFLLRTDPASEKLRITSLSAVVHMVANLADFSLELAGFNLV